MSEQRHVRLFRIGRYQAVHIPMEFELPGDEAIMHRAGNRLVIAPEIGPGGEDVECVELDIHAVSLPHE